MTSMVERGTARESAAGENWAGNVEYRSERFYEPQSVAEAQEIVARSDKVRPLGTRHCFNRLAGSDHAQISVRAMHALLEIDEEAGTATVEAGASYGQISEALHRNGHALPNLASLPHISVVGAAATATHGSGPDNQNMATSVAGVEFIDAQGDLVTLSRAKDGNRFDGVPVHLGGLGLITKVKLDLVPTFDVRQHVYLDLPVASARANFEEIMGSGYSVSLFTDYRGDTIKQVWVKQKAEGSPRAPLADFHGATAATEAIHPAEAPPENTTDQLGTAGPWYDRLPHFKMDFTPSNGEELQSEFFVSREHAVDAYDAVAQHADAIAPHLIISELRLIDEDDLWMSTAYGEPKVAFHFTWRMHPEAVRAVLPKIEAALRPYEPRPHWGKVFTMSPRDVQARYDRLGDFKELLATYDPNGKFRNRFLEYYLYGAGEPAAADMW